MEKHNALVATIAARVKQFSERKQPFRLYHGSTNSTRRSQRSADNTIDTSQLKHILSVDTAGRTALVEPNVPLDLMLQEATKHGLVPPVVMELPGITVGGGFSGTSGESSSFRYGAFDATICSIEIVLPDGTVTKASKTDKPDLFWGAASAFGTLGVVTLLEINLKEAKKYVQLTYTRSPSMSDAVVRLKEECAKDANDYVDGITFQNSTLVCVGRLTDELPAGTKARQFTRRKDPWFCLRAQEVEKSLTKKTDQTAITDYIPLADYLFRFDRGAFWVARYAYRYFLTPFNRITRFVLDPLMHTRQMYCALHKSGLIDDYMVQDVGVPFDRAPEFLAFLEETFGLFPLWLCPLRLQRDDPNSAHGLHSEFAKPGTQDLLNFGVWGPLPKGAGGAVGAGRREAVRLNRVLEQKVQELGGKKWLYAQAFYTEEEFWAHYDRASYDALRTRYGATYLPSVYDKVCVDVEAEQADRTVTWQKRARTTVGKVWPLRGLYGVYKTVTGSEYLLQKEKRKQKQDDAPAEKNGVTA